DKGDLDRSSVSRATRKAIATIYVNSAIEEYKRGNLFVALNYVNQAIAWDEEFASAHLLKGSILLSLRMDDQALTEWQTVITLSPMSKEAELAKEGIATIYYNKGIRAYQAGDTISARQWLTLALTTAPGSDIAKKAEDALSRITLESLF
ncbi:MAG: hypothetical protein H5T69_21340, partial [Chloroflexi bacterium]|nr:hypothetical protein [Chloroflexota bacterium]